MPILIEEPDLDSIHEGSITEEGSWTTERMDLDTASVLLPSLKDRASQAPGEEDTKNTQFTSKDHSQEESHSQTSSDSSLSGTGTSTSTRETGIGRLRSLGLYTLVGFFMLFCAVYIIIKTFTPSPTGLLSRDCPCEKGLEQCICARETIEALTPFQIFCLFNSRVSAYMLYPLYMLLFLTMARNLRAFLQYTIVAEYIPLTSLHHLHAWAGTWVGVGITWHGLFHIIRWGVQDNWQFLVRNQTGLTGLISLIITPLLVWPMRLRSLRQAIHFEVRKRLHYLSWVWAASICFHAPAEHIFWIIGTVLVIYLLDWFYGVFANTHVAPSARFVRLESSVMIRVPKPERFSMEWSSAYCYLCIPWLTKCEWHAVTAFKDPFEADYVCFCISMAGDWTKKLNDAVKEPIQRRIWLYGPFPSPFEMASRNDQIISVASGIGITPALSVIQSLALTRKMHLVWIVRDASLLEFMMDYGTRLDECAFTFVFYTGERELIFKRSLPYNVFLLKGRPNLAQLIPSLIRSAQLNIIPSYLAKRSGRLEHNIHEDQLDLESATTGALEHHFYAEFNRLLLTYTQEELWRAAVRRSRLNSHVTYEGLRDFVESACSRQFSDKQLRALFDRIDVDGLGAIDSTEFKDFLHRIEKETQKHHLKKTIHSVKNQGAFVNESSVIRLASGGGEDLNSIATTETKVDKNRNWRVMYCGGSARVEEELNEISAELQIALSVESFQW